MYDLDHVYRLQNESNIEEMLTPFYAIDYLGEALPSGPDCAIEVVDGKIVAYLDGQLCPAGHGLLEVAEDFKVSILKHAAKLKGRHGAKVIFTGRWHHPEPSFDQMAIMYLIHVVSKSGDVKTTKYELDVFDWDGSSNAQPFDVCIGFKTLQRFIYGMRTCAERELELDTAVRSASGRHFLDGVIYFPVTGKGNLRPPVVVVKAVGIRALGNEISLKAGNETLNDAFARYTAALNDLKELAAAAPADGEVSDEIQASYVSVQEEAERLSGLRYELLLHSDLRSALADSQFGVFRGQIRRRDSVTEAISFTELHDLGVVDDVGFEILLENVTETVKSSEGLWIEVPKPSEVRYVTKVFDDNFRETASDFTVRRRDIGPDESLRVGRKYVSDWRDYGEDRKARIVV
jgi:hypothetical protein